MMVQGLWPVSERGLKSVLSSCSFSQLQEGTYPGSDPRLCWGNLPSLPPVTFSLFTGYQGGPITCLTCQSSPLCAGGPRALAPLLC